MPPLSPPARFRDPESTKYGFTDLVLVRCPRCERVARVVPDPEPAGDARHPAAWTSPAARRRLVCRACGLTRRYEGPAVFRWGETTDPYFRQPLWLRTETRHGTLWAYNLEQLDLLRRFVGAALRERPPWYEHYRKMSYIGRLPAWIKRGKNREEILRAVDRLRASVVE
ncbi:hypothetical protein [Streptomyces huiliensis]|uniref:hypothetical protein n=1 Tax=Streptomyces huiliensis TaxID=2876027 RepID=UPI001CBD563A|nr:hypothetical protein [Streptomyces huiliensis]MBZ4322578.1 hypothetical protein [Streptomyces huiliensis]